MSFQKFLQKIAIFSLAMFVWIECPKILRAMDYEDGLWLVDDDELTERTALKRKDDYFYGAPLWSSKRSDDEILQGRGQKTAYNLCERANYIEPSCWQHVEIIDTDNYRDNNKLQYNYSICCISFQASDSDLVILKNLPYSPLNSKNKAISWKDAKEIIQARNNEMNARLRREERIYQIQLPKLNFENATYDGDHYPMVYRGGPGNARFTYYPEHEEQREKLRQLGVCGRIIADLEAAQKRFDEDEEHKRKRSEQQERERIKRVEEERKQRVKQEEARKERNKSENQRKETTENSQSSKETEKRNREKREQEEREQEERKKREASAWAIRQEDARREAQRQEDAKRFQENRRKEEEARRAYEAGRGRR